MILKVLGPPLDQSFISDEALFVLKVLSSHNPTPIFFPSNEFCPLSIIVIVVRTVVNF